MCGIDEMSMHCEPCRPEAYCTYVGASQGEQGAAARDSEQAVGRPTKPNKKKP
jgi:hypothetical protein